MFCKLHSSSFSVLVSICKSVQIGKKRKESTETEFGDDDYEKIRKRRTVMLETSAVEDSWKILLEKADIGLKKTLDWSQKIASLVEYVEIYFRFILFCTIFIFLKNKY